MRRASSGGHPGSFRGAGDAVVSCALRRVQELLNTDLCGTLRRPAIDHEAHGSVVTRTPGLCRLGQGLAIAVDVDTSALV